MTLRLFHLYKYVLTGCAIFIATSCSSNKSSENNQADAAIETEKYVSGLDSANFAKYWMVESESPDYKVTFRHSLPPSL